MPIFILFRPFAHIRVLLRGAIYLVAALILAGCAHIETPAPLPAIPAAQPAPPSIETMEAQTVQLVNAEREKRGLSTLAVNTTLTGVARDYSALMGRENFFSHYDKNNKNVGDRVEAMGINYHMVGENLFKSINAPDPIPLAIEGWMKSPKHRENILTPEYTQTGIGVWRSGATYYFTQVFLLPR